jgi:hypothetical protein
MKTKLPGVAYLCCGAEYTCIAMATVSVKLMLDWLSDRGFPER